MANTVRIQVTVVAHYKEYPGHTVHDLQRKAEVLIVVSIPTINHAGTRDSTAFRIRFEAREWGDSLRIDHEQPLA